MTDADEPVENALEALRDAIRARIRAEQLLDRLTRLPNDEALVEFLSSSIEEDDPFWAAFVEVDKFKSINDDFGYDEADGFLKRIAEVMRALAQHDATNAIVPFRAHGDEFFMVGRGEFEPAGVAALLERVRAEIAAIRIAVRDRERPLQGTVSIGWLCEEDSANTAAGLTWRSVRTHLELAAAEAKVTRDAVVRFTADMQRAQRREARADCADCTTKFSLSVPLGKEREGDLFCPNCATEIARPESVSRPPDPPTATA